MNTLLIGIFGILLIGAGLSTATASIVHIADANGITVQQARTGGSLGHGWTVLGDTPVREDAKTTSSLIF